MVKVPSLVVRVVSFWAVLAAPMVTVPPDWLVKGTWMTTASARALGDQRATRGHGQAAAGPADVGHSHWNPTPK